MLNFTKIFLLLITFTYTAIAHSSPLGIGNWIDSKTSISMNCPFTNEDRITANTSANFNCRSGFDNTYGYIEASKIVINAPDIKFPNDPKLGKVCFHDSFLLNGISIPSSYSHCA